MSLVEAVANVVFGYVVAVTTRALVFPAFGPATMLKQSLAIGLIFTLVSLVRSYALRRLFEGLRPETTLRASQHAECRTDRDAHNGLGALFDQDALVRRFMAYWRHDGFAEARRP